MRCPRKFANRGRYTERPIQTAHVSGSRSKREAGRRCRRLRHSTSRTRMRTQLSLALFEQIRVPTLILAGGADMTAPPPLIKILAARIKGAEFAVHHTNVPGLFRGPLVDHKPRSVCSRPSRSGRGPYTSANSRIRCLRLHRVGAGIDGADGMLAQLPAGMPRKCCAAKTSGRAASAHPSAGERPPPTRRRAVRNGGGSGGIV